MTCDMMDVYAVQGALLFLMLHGFLVTVCAFSALMLLVGLYKHFLQQSSKGFSCIWWMWENCLVIQESGCTLGIDTIMVIDCTYSGVIASITLRDAHYRVFRIVPGSPTTKHFKPKSCHSFVSWLYKIELEIWANAKRDGYPAEYRWRPLFSAAKFGWRPLLECRAVTLPRRRTRWNVLGCPELANKSQPLVGQSLHIVRTCGAV